MGINESLPGGVAFGTSRDPRCRSVCIGWLLGLSLILSPFGTQSGDAAAPPMPESVRPESIGTLWGSPQSGVLSFSPDGRTLLADNGPEGALLLWEMASHRPRAALKQAGHP